MELATLLSLSLYENKSIEITVNMHRNEKGRVQTNRYGTQ